MKYFKKVIGDKCYLSPIRPEDAEKYAEWLNDARVSMNLTNFTQQLTLENEKDFLEQVSKEGQYVFAIVASEKDNLIGNCGLMNVDFINRKADFGIFIGDRNYWGLGYGGEAIKLLLDYAFNILNLHTIGLNVYEFNQRAIRCYKKCGFKEIGRRRQGKFLNGKFNDIVLMDIISSEYESVYFKKISIQ